MRKTKYTRLDRQDREEISRGLAAGESFAAIAFRINRHASTVSHDVRAGGGRAGYRAESVGRNAARRASSRRMGKTKLAGCGRLRRCIHAAILKNWSPKEVARRIRAECPHDMKMRISHEAIYDRLYVLPRGKLRESLLKGIDFRTVPTRELKRMQRQLNDRPRQVLDHLKPVPLACS